MSRKQEHTSSGGFCSKPAYILWTIDNSWYSQESSGWNPDWFTLNNLFSSINGKIKLKIILSNILLHIGKSETGLLLFCYLRTTRFSPKNFGNWVHCISVSRFA